MANLGIGDLGAAYGLTSGEKVKLKYGTTEDKTTLDMDDFLQLMVVSLQNQSIDSTADTSDMMNQMVQMSVVQAISDISALIEDSTTLNYAASLVGKDVTIGKWEGEQLKEISGTIMGTGTLNGQQVVFLEGDSNAYYLTDIMGIGKLPEKIILPDDMQEEENQNPGIPGTEGTEGAYPADPTLPTDNPNAPGVEDGMAQDIPGNVSGDAVNGAEGSESVL